MRTVTCLLSLVLASAASAQVAIGNYPLEPITPPTTASLPLTTVDVSSPATAAGAINTVAVRVFGRSCPGNAFKVKFFTRSGNTLTMLAERGPFAVTEPFMTLTLSPAVTVPAGALIGVTQLLNCGEVAGQSPAAGKEAYEFAGDVTTATLSSGTQRPFYSLGVYGADSPNAEIRTQIIIAAGAAQGQGGASFKTDLFLGNLRERNARGRLVYHPAGTAGTTSDPSFAFDVASLRSTSLPNFVGQSLGRTGLGSIDVYTKIGFEPPTLSARIYDDAGAAGTKGFTFDALQPTEALAPFENAVLFAPADSRSRMNIGIRTLDQGGEIQFFVRGADGFLRGGMTQRSYPPNFFAQDTAANITGVTLQPGDYVIVYSQQIPFFAYASTTDNATNDPSVQVAKHLK